LELAEHLPALEAVLLQADPTHLLPEQQQPLAEALEVAVQELLVQLVVLVVAVAVGQTQHKLVVLALLVKVMLVVRVALLLEKPLAVAVALVVLVVMAQLTKAVLVV
jgi:hypothetical protein